VVSEPPNIAALQKGRTMDFLVDGPADSDATFLFAHGAGGPMDSGFMVQVARALAAGGIRVVRFEFPYMAARRTGKKSGAPDRQSVLLASFQEAIDAYGGGPRVFVGGKSMGGRMASMVADEAGVRGLVVFGYPFHPPGKPQQTRTAHLADFRTPALILQGTRDPFGTPADVSTYELSKNIRVEWLEGGDHSLKGGVPRAIELAAAFMGH
jgi:predicted alpha/beta-hydrolase family hydrolase